MGLAPLQPPVPLPNAFQLPQPTLDIPLVNPPRWVPIPSRLEEHPEPNVPNTEPSEEVIEEPVRSQPVVPTPVQQAPPVPSPQLPEIETELPPSPANLITIPVIEIDIPLPSNEIMITATTTATIAAVASVGGALVAKTFFDYLLRLIKPLLKIILKKIQKTRGKSTTTWARQRLKRQRK